MQNIDLPASVVIPGDPAALRAAAQGVRTVADTTGQEASRQALASREASAGGWSGSAGDAFRAAATDGRARIDQVVGVLPDLGAPLLTYADTLERLQREYEEVRATAQGLAGRIRTTPREAPESAGLGDAYLAVDGRLAAIVAEVAAADWTAAAAVTAAGSRLVNAETASRQRALLAASSAVSYPLAAQTARIAAELGEDSTAAKAGKVAGRVLGPVGSGLGQAIQDAENPNYSTVERIGRATTRALVVGVPATTAGAAIGIPAGLAAGAVTGPVGAFVGGAAAWYGASTLATSGLDELPITDDVVDTGGEIFDWFGEQLRPRS